MNEDGSTYTVPGPGYEQYPDSGFCSGNHDQYATEPASASFTVQMIATLTWVPDPNVPNDNPPPRICVFEQATASAGTEWLDCAEGGELAGDWDQHSERVTVSASDGIGSPQTNPWASCAQSAGGRLTVMAGQSTIVLPAVTLTASGTIEPGQFDADFDYGTMDAFYEYQASVIAVPFMARRHVVEPPGATPDSAGLAFGGTDIATGGLQTPEQMADVAVYLGNNVVGVDASQITPLVYPNPLDGDAGSFTPLGGACLTDSSGIAVIGTMTSGDDIDGVYLTFNGIPPPYDLPCIFQNCNMALRPTNMTQGYSNTSTGAVKCLETLDVSTPVTGHPLQFSIVSAVLLVRQGNGFGEQYANSSDAGGCASFSPTTAATDGSGTATSTLTVTSSPTATVLSLTVQVLDTVTLQAVTTTIGP
jgi:hypothetical protein